ncbi:XRE family transcriptional regulator [Pediococcus pentosaceus]|uniref:XRE family transcriptional regulator n=1 Tax=Pediococcus pentosaceus TaxID=1255 RepID=UPI0018A1A93B|nr:XRE family transcriptional regulator [Pediococcus pentosaceus]MBF7128477.1 XRE family transcriptional regulator [Pediococcus pentosaceus]MBF7133310.1 XRE family transcriptional regulator [Pediococcus pentosaceus]
MKKRIIYRQLKGWLVSNNISQKRVGEIIGTTANVVNKKINGTGSDFKLSEARTLHNKLKVPTDCFFEIEVPLSERKETC